MLVLLQEVHLCIHLQSLKHDYIYTVRGINIMLYHFRRRYGYGYGHNDNTGVAYNP